MITVKVLQGRTGIRGYKIKGHAGFAEEGQDIVCAGVSVLAQTAIIGLEQFLPGKFLYKIGRSGSLECRLHSDLTPQQDHDAQVILVTMLQGLEAMRQEYGEFIEIALQEVKEA